MEAHSFPFAAVGKEGRAGAQNVPVSAEKLAEKKNTGLSTGV